MIAFLERRAQPSTQTRVEGHVAECDECRRVLSALAGASGVATATSANLAGSDTAQARRGAEASDDEAQAELALAATEVAIGARGEASPDEGACAAEGLEPGASVGRYRVLGPVGAGGMGVVYAAFDPELARKVALKFLRPDVGGGEAQRQLEARLQREARAMAKLAHPNVAAVHDVGRYGGRVFVAMEFIEGPTLGRWLGQRKRPLPEVLEAFVAAGRGLAAAHAAGLVHRDFKPENALVGDDGRVRVVDFGLARPFVGAETGEGAPPASVATGRGGVAVAVHGGGEEAEEAVSASTSRAAGLTAAGAIVGTPAYMAPEQHRGREADAKSDQFSFCVALYEALYGERPFGGASLGELRAAVTAGRVRPAPRGARVPGWLRRVLLRGLSPAPDGRYPSMGELLAALGRDPGRYARRAVTGAAVVGLLAGGALWARPSVEPPCRGGERHLQGVWDATRRRSVEAALLRTGAPYAEAAAREVGRVLDGYAAQWTSQHAEACEATRVRGEQTEELMGLRMTCLEDRRHELRALSDRLIEADRELAERSVQAVYRLSEIEGCANVRALQSPVRPPSDATTRAEVERLRVGLGEARALEHAGRYEEGLGAARALSERAAALGYRPLEAEAFYLLGDLAEKSADYGTAERSMERAALAAEAGRHDELVARSLGGLVWVRSYRQARYDQVEPLSQRATAVLERLGGDGELEAQLRVARGTVEMERARYPEAERELGRALALLEPRYGENDLRLADLFATLCRLASHRDQIDAARGHCERALAIRRSALGDEHPAVAQAFSAMAGVYHYRHEYAEAEANYGRALAALERAFGPDHPKVIRVLYNLALTYEWQGRKTEAIALYRRASSVAEKGLGAEHPDTAIMLGALGAAFEEDDQLDEAMPLLERVLGLLRQRFGGEHPRVAEVLREIALVHMKRGRTAEARKAMQQCLAAYRRSREDGEAPGDALRIMGEIELRARRPERALEPLERALEVQGRPGAKRDNDPSTVALTKAQLAMALFDAGRDKARAKALAHEAYEHMKADARMAKERAEFERWMARRRLR